MTGPSSEVVGAGCVGCTVCAPGVVVRATGVVACVTGVVVCTTDVVILSRKWATRIVLDLDSSLPWPSKRDGHGGPIPKLLAQPSASYQFTTLVIAHMFDE